MPACILLKLYFCLVCLVYSLKDSLTPNLGKTLCTGLVASVVKLVSAGVCHRGWGRSTTWLLSPNKEISQEFSLLRDACTNE